MNPNNLNPTEGFFCGVFLLPKILTIPPDTAIMASLFLICEERAKTYRRRGCTGQVGTEGD